VKHTADEKGDCDGRF